MHPVVTGALGTPTWRRHQGQARGAGNQRERPEGRDDIGGSSLLNRLREEHGASEVSCHSATNRHKGAPVRWKVYALWAVMTDCVQ